MNLRTLLIDDEPDALDKLESYAATIPYLEVVAVCHSSSMALEVVQREQIDVVFTDIEMPDINGLRFVEALPARTMVVFITAYRDYAVDGFRLSAIDYLVKPYSLSDFRRACGKCLEVHALRHQREERTPAQRNDSLFIKVENRFERIPLADIVYIKGYGEYLQIYVEGSSRPLLTISSFAAILEKLDDSFLQVHRSYIVNMEKVTRLEKRSLTVDTTGDPNSGVLIPVSNTHRDLLIEYMRTRTIGRLPAH